MFYNYIIETEKILLEGIEKNNSIFFTHSIPKLYKKPNETFHRGLNQLKLAQCNLYENTVSSIDIINSNIKIPFFEKPVLICEKNKKNKKYLFNFYYGIKIKKKSNKFKTEKKIYYDLSEINDIIEYYFSCSINSEPYVPVFNQKQKNMFINYITYHPYDFSKITNDIFDKLIRELKYE